MSRAWVVVATAAWLAPASARAAGPLDMFDGREGAPKGAPTADVCKNIPGNADFTHEHPDLLEYYVAEQETTAPGYFNGIGTPCHYWEGRSDTAFDTKRVFTQHFELARAFTWKRYLAVVARVGFGMESDTTESFYTLQGPLASIGLRARAPSSNYWVEFGLRVIPNWSGPNDTDPRALQLALAATLSSGIADDAAWLQLADFGVQIYGAFESRTRRWAGKYMTSFLGAHWGGNASLAPMSVRSWLGPQTAFVGNVFAEGFLGLPVVAKTELNLEVGVHGEVSLSSIWPGNELFPVLGNVYLAWSPKTWVALRVFGGFAGSPTDPQTTNTHYGARLQFFVP